MRYAKILSFIIVITMVSSGLIVVAEAIDESQGDEIPTVTIDKLVDDTSYKNKYWVNATLVTGNPNYVKLTNYAGGLDCIVTGSYNGASYWQLADGFVIPSDSAINPGQSVYSDGEITVCGDIYGSYNTTGVTNIDGGYVNYMVLADGATLNFNSGDWSTSTREKIGTMPRIQIYDDATINVNGGYMRAEIERQSSPMTHSELQLNINGGKLESRTEFLDTDSVTVKLLGGSITSLTIMIVGEDGGRQGIEFENVTSQQTADGGNFETKYDRRTKQITLSGDLMGSTGKGRLTTNSDKNGEYVLDNFTLTNMYMYLGDNDSFEGKIILKNDFINLYTDSYVVERYSGMSENQIVAANGEAKFASNFVYFGVNNNPFYYINVYTCNTEGVKDKGTVVLMIASDGVERIETGSEYGEYVVLKVGDIINLSDYKVVCKSGYTFDGWYYKDIEGVEHKVSNADQFVVAEGMALYAKAVQEQKDYTPFFIALFVLIAIIAIAAFAIYIAKSYY